MIIIFESVRQVQDNVPSGLCQMAVIYRNRVAALIATAWLGLFVLCNGSQLLGAEDNDSWFVKDGSRTTTVLEATGVSYADGLRIIATAVQDGEVPSKGDSAFFPPAASSWVMTNTRCMFTRQAKMICLMRVVG